MGAAAQIPRCDPNRIAQRFAVGHLKGEVAALLAVGEASEVLRRPLVRVEIKSLTNRDSLDRDRANLVRGES